MSEHWGMPGPGGSLGKCGVCGESFVTEVLMGESVESFSVTGGPRMYAHDKCIKILKGIEGKDWKALPDGPLRQAFTEQENQTIEKDNA